ncbi:hypothetical protein YC2023_042361 [Brassica napus]
MRVRRGFAGEERWRKAGIVGEGEKSPDCSKLCEDSRRYDSGIHVQVATH